MDMQLMEDVYDTLRGVLIPQARIAGVENAFAQGEECARLYGQMLDAYERLCARLGVVDEDEDVEIIINSMIKIQHVLSRKMYMYGARFGAGTE